MDTTFVNDLITNLGFPIAAVVFLSWFVYKIYNDITKQNQVYIEQMQSRCKEREDWLKGTIAEAQETNAKFVEIIGQYEAKLDDIREDVKEIKQTINQKR